MAQPNVVREPSMDEILASIRRIIESNEPVPQAGMASTMVEPEGFLGRPANDDSEEVTLTVDDAFASEDDYRQSPIAAPAPMAAHPLRGQPMSDYREPEPERNQPPVQSAEPAAMQPKSLSLADVAARVRAAAERGQAERSASFSEEPARPVKVEQPVQVAERYEAPLQETHFSHFEEAARPALVEAPVAPQMEAEAVSQPMALLSSSVGEQVARSFQDLAFAVDDADRRSIDQVAEDMLRPMLQEWLDDNLPTLVERLVREEIERVARGTRR